MNLAVEGINHYHFERGKNNNLTKKLPVVNLPMSSNGISRKNPHLLSFNITRLVRKGER